MWNKIQGLSSFNFNRNNKYADAYYLAYKKATVAQENIDKCEKNQNISFKQYQKYVDDLKYQEKEIERLAKLAKKEENKIEEKNKLGSNVDFLA